MERVEKLNVQAQIFAKSIDLLTVFRYVSLAITGIFYFSQTIASTIYLKLSVFICLTIVSIVVSRLYRKYENDTESLKAICVIESVGIALLLIPTRGLDSPFIWYAINPVLDASVRFLPRRSFLIGGLYLFLATIMTAIHLQQPNILAVISLYSDTYLAYIVTYLTLFILIEQNKKLKHEKIKTTNAISQLMELYELINAFSTATPRSDVYATYLSYLKKLTESDYVFWMDHHHPTVYAIGLSEEEKKRVYDQLLDCGHKKPFKNQISINEKMVMRIYPVLTNYALHGFLGIEVNSASFSQRLSIDHCIRLFGLVLDRFFVESNEFDLLRLEEQNRIANEIHDNVSQRLFSITCATHCMMKELPDMHNQLLVIQSTAQSALKELQTAIYDLSLRRNQETPFKDSLIQHLSMIEQMHHITVNMVYEINECDVTYPIKCALYRMISEGCANAVRHGKCSRIELSLIQGEKEINVMISDNGTGFDRKIIKRGLGLHNIESLANNYDGQVNIESNIGKGTRVRVFIPLISGELQRKGG